MYGEILYDAQTEEDNNLSGGNRNHLKLGVEPES